MKTTRELAKEIVHDDRAKALQGLLVKNYDAEAGYRKAMQIAESDVLIEFLKEGAAQRSRFANELDQELRNLNETPVESGSTTANLHRTWMDVKKFLRKSSDEAMLEECIKGEKASLKEYDHILKHMSFAPETEILLKKQFNSIKDSLEEVEDMEEMLEIHRRTSKF